MSKVSTFMLLALFAVIASCTNRSRVIEQTLSNIANRELKIDYDSMDLINPKTNRIDLSKSQLIWVVYFHRDYCKSCFLKDLMKWKAFRDEYHHMSIVGIISGEVHDSQRIKDELYEMDLDFPVYWDKYNIFKEENKQITEDRMYHTFLLDESNIVKMVGNPVYNQRIKKIFDDYYKRKINE